LADLPIVIVLALRAGAFAAEALDAHAVALLDDLRLPIGSHRFRIILPTRIPHGKQDDFLSVPQFLDPEIAVIEPAGHEVAARRRLLDRHLVEEGRPCWRRIPEMHRSTGALWLVLAHDHRSRGQQDKNMDSNVSMH